MFPSFDMRPLLLLAPMAGFTNAPFRALCTTRGADLVYSEMVSARGLFFGGEKTARLLERHPKESGFVVQLFGDEPSIVADAAVLIEELGTVDAIDINFGCPVKKVAKSGSGAVLLDHPERARAIVRAVRKAISLPLSIKVRLGWSPSRPAARSFAKIAADEGCSHIIVHARWATQFYKGQADWEQLADLWDIPIPVVVNGDIKTVEQAQRALEVARAQGLAIGRGALVRPDLFADLANRIGKRGAPFEEHADTPARRMEIALHLLREGQSVDERSSSGALAHIRLRSHLMYLVSGFAGASALRKSLLSCESAQALVELLDGVQSHFAASSACAL